ncbi:MAG: elongation factor P maturation arginine rhamnosyltransferase EarP [Pseudomonadota bacterium]|nr:elongation factor P maturation arginine rhamnosyltransferase EarP [Pseudomonadota bacterium]
MPVPPSRWDVFCTVVDNYGDVGVAWRLARQLAGEQAIAVRLFVDDMHALARLAPEIDAASGGQRAQGVDVRRWGGAQADFAADPGDVVVEAFGCGLPPAYLGAMAARGRPPVWINLEYLSAESWIEGCHGLASRHATLPLTRYFFFPGFTAKSGGLLRERDLLLRRDRFRADPRAREALWGALGIAAPASEALIVSLFCYPNAPLRSLLDAWVEGDRPLLCIVPEGTASAVLEQWTSSAGLHAGKRFGRSALTLAAVPFVAQENYDQLLWACDVNFVRGEDSFVRAQWAARPLVWHVYPQAENAHRLKLDAFLARYSATLAPDPAAALRSLSTAWNGEGDAGAAWPKFVAALPELRIHATSWAPALAAQPELAEGLVKFCVDRV